MAYYGPVVLHTPHDSLIGCGGSILAVIIPGGVFVQHFCPIWSPRHDIQPVASLQWVLAPRTRLMLCLQEGGGWLDAEQRARAHENWKVGVKRGRQKDVKKRQSK